MLSQKTLINWNTRNGREFLRINARKRVGQSKWFKSRWLQGQIGGHVIRVKICNRSQQIRKREPIWSHYVNQVG